MERLKTAAEQIRMSPQQEQDLLTRLQTAAAEEKRPLRRRKLLLAGIAASLLLALALPLLKGLINGDPQFSLIAYAADQPGVTLIEGQAAKFQVEEGFFGGQRTYGLDGSFGGGDTLIKLRFVCQGEGVASISYTSEDCEFVEVLHLWPGDPLYEVSGKQAWEEHQIYLITGPGQDEEGRVTHPQKTANVLLGHSYSVAYDQQDDHLYMVRLDLYEVEPTTRTEDGRRRGGVYDVEDVRIQVDITMENGRVYTKNLLLEAETDLSLYEAESYYILPDEETYLAMSEAQRLALYQEARDQGCWRLVMPGFDFESIARCPTAFHLSII